LVSDFTNNQYKLYINHNSSPAISLIGSESSSNTKPFFYSYYAGGLVLDWMGIRKYSSPDPAMVSSGSEETSLNYGQLTSILIAPQSFGSWQLFQANLSDVPYGTNATFSLLDGSGNIVYTCGYAQAQAGCDISGISTESLYIRTQLSSNSSVNTPSLDRYNMTWSGVQNYTAYFEFSNAYGVDLGSRLNLTYMGAAVAIGSGNMTANVTRYRKYNLISATNTSNDIIESRIIGLNITQNNLRIRQQVVTNYTGSMPSGYTNISSVYALNETGLIFDYVTLTLPKRGVGFDAVGHCTTWRYTTANCTTWEINATTDFQYTENSTHVLLNITSFTSAYSLLGRSGSDLTVTNITYSSSQSIEGQLIQVNVTVMNNGASASGNFTLELNASLYNGSYALDVRSLQNMTSISASTSAVTTFNWAAKVGTYRFDAYVDIFNSAAETNETNNQLSVNYTTTSWHTMYGMYNYSLQLLVNNSFLSWNTSSITGNIYFSDVDSVYNPTDLRPLNGTNFLAFADQALQMAYFNDSIRSLYDPNNDTWPDAFTQSTIAGTAYYIPVINSTNSSTFVTGLMYDSADGTPYDGTQDIVFVTMLNMGRPGKYGFYDYEVKLPSRLAKLKGSLIGVLRVDEIN
jgi:hypothetical protein